MVIKMRAALPFYKLPISLVVVLIAASCSPKQKKEQPVSNADSTKQSEKISPPKVKDSIIEKPVEKKEIRAAARPPKKSSPQEANPEVKKEPLAKPAVEPVKEPVK